MSMYACVGVSVKVYVCVTYIIIETACSWVIMTLEEVHNWIACTKLGITVWVGVGAI